MSEILNHDALGRVLGTAAGRRVIYDILAASRMFQQPFVPGDPSLTTFNCGSLNVAHIIYADCNAVSPDLTAMMLKEPFNAGPGTIYDADASHVNGTASQPVSTRDPADRNPLGFDRFGFGGTGDQAE